MKVTRGKVSKLVNSFGSNWGRIQPAGQTREIFFNRWSLVDPSKYGEMLLGQEVEFAEEPDRAAGTHAVRVRTRACLEEQPK